MSASTGKKRSSPPAAGAVFAEPGQRLVARLIDTLIVGLPVALVARALLPESAYGARPAETATAVGVAVCYLLYDTVQHALWGRTIGKRLTGVKVVPAVQDAARAADLDGDQDSDQDGAQDAVHRAEAGGGRVGLPRALLRAAVFALPIAARPVPVLGVIAGIVWVAGVAWVLEPTRRQALHDRIAATNVTRIGPATPPPPPP